MYDFSNYWLLLPVDVIQKSLFKKNEENFPFRYGHLNIGKAKKEYFSAF